MIGLDTKSIRVPELYGDFWFNSEPISLRAMKGSVVAVDFWNYSSANCVRALPYLKEWQRKYRPFEFLVVGVHTPEYKFGRKPEHVERSLHDLGIQYPIVMDNEALIWSSFGAREWPTRYLIDKDGFIRYTHYGDGGYDRFERNLQALLNEGGYRGELPELMEPLRAADLSGSVRYRQTQDIQAGYLRGTIGNPEGYSPESTLQYVDQGFYLNGRLYLHGKWFHEREFIRFDGEKGEEGYATLRYEAVGVNAVMESRDRTSSELYIYQDGNPLTEASAGSDVQFDSHRRSFVRVTEPRLFNLVHNQEFGGHTLRIETSSPFLLLYSFSFVTTVIPDLITNN